MPTQWPVNGSRGDPVFYAFTAANGPISSSDVSVESTKRTSGSQLLNASPDLLRANMNIEPGNIPFTSLIGHNTVAGVGRSSARPCGLTYTPLQLDPPVTDCSAITTAEVGPDSLARRSCILQTSKIHKITQLNKVLYIMITGEASPYITYYHCFVESFEQMGLTNYLWIKLVDIGIEGNLHFMSLEKNNQEVAAAINYGLMKLNKHSVAPDHPNLPNWI